jgi:hypothetical protein
MSTYATYADHESLFYAGYGHFVEVGWGGGGCSGSALEHGKKHLPYPVSSYIQITYTHLCYLNRGHMYILLVNVIYIHILLHHG